MRRKQEETFAEMQARLPEKVISEELVWLSPIGAGEYVDEGGVRWTLRGGTPPVRRVEKLLVDPLVTVIHVYVDAIREVSFEERAEFLAKIRPYLKGEQTTDDHTDFEAGEFTNGSGQSLVVVEEFC